MIYNPHDSRVRRLAYSIFFHQSRAYDLTL